MKKMAQLYDLVQEEEQDNRDQGLLEGTPPSGLFEDKVTCNGVEMTRESVEEVSWSDVMVIVTAVVLSCRECASMGRLFNNHILYSLA